MKRILLALTLAPVCFGALGTPIVTNNLTAPADWSYWFANGSMTETADGLNSSTNGSLIYGVTLPSNYEVRLKYKFANSGGSYVTYFRATSNANLQANTGTFYAAEFSNVTMARTSCNTLLTLWRRDGATLSMVLQTWTACAPDMELSIAVRDNTVIVYCPYTMLLYFLIALPSTYPNPAAPSYQGGAGVAGTPSGNGIARGDIYAIDTTGGPHVTPSFYFGFTAADHHPMAAIEQPRAYNSAAPQYRRPQGGPLVLHPLREPLTTRKRLRPEEARSWPASR